MTHIETQYQALQKVLRAKTLVTRAARELVEGTGSLEELKAYLAAESLAAKELEAVQ